MMVRFPHLPFTPSARLASTTLLGLLLSANVANGAPVAGPAPDGNGDPSPAFEILQQQARYWDNRGRGDLAAGALRRILASEPDNAQALYEIGLLMISEGDITSARTFESRLRRQEDAYELAVQLRREVDNAEVDRNLLNEARRRAAEGEIEVALGLYEKLFSGREIGGGLAVEYYETLAGMEERWADATDGLRSHYDRQPNNGRVRLAMAKVMSYREETRREALYHFSALLDDAVYREDALSGMRETLLWLNASPDDQDYYNRYLALSKDEAVAEKLALALNPKVVDAFTASRIEAYKALNQGQLKVAEQRFKELLSQRSNDAESLGGMGLIKLRNQQFSAAADYLNRAIRSDPTTRRNFASALAEARFWSTHSEVVRHIDRGEYDQALQAANSIQGKTAKQQAEIHLLKARIASETSDPSEAERQTRLALSIDDSNPNAAATLLTALGDAHRYEELDKQLTQFQRQASRGTFQEPQSRAAMRRGQAQVATWRQDWEAALAAYEQAVRADPNDVWIRLEYARLLVQLDRRREAEALVSGLSRQGSNTDAIHALALYYAEIENWERCLATIERIPSNQRSKDVSSLADTAQIKHRITLALQRSSMGDRTTAVNELLALQELRTTSPYKTVLVADGLLELGLNEQAGLTVKRALADKAAPPVDVTVQYARILGEAGELNSAYRLMTDLMLRRNELTAGQRSEMAQVYDGILLRATRRAISNREYDQALSYLEPLYRNNPVDGAVLRHLGEVHQQMGNYTTARKFYESAMAVDTTDLWAVKGAVGAALDEEDIEAASRILDIALSRFPDDPDVYTLISRTAHSANDLDMAIEAAERAKVLKRNRDLPEVEAPYDYQSPPGDRLPPMSPQNPFRVEATPARQSHSGRDQVVTIESYPLPQVKSDYKPAWHEGWSLRKVSWQDDDPAESAPSGSSDDWKTLTSGESLDALIHAEIESTRQAMTGDPVPAERGSGSDSATVEGLPTPLALDTILQLATMLAEQGKHDQVEQVVLSIMGANNLSPAVQSQLTELLYPSALYLAETALEHQDHLAAFEHLRPILNAKATRDDVRFIRIMASYSQSVGELDKSAAFFDQALILTPMDEALRIQAVGLRMQMNDLAAANTIAAAGLERDPGSSRLHFIVGRIAKELGDLNSAMEHFLLARQSQAGGPGSRAASTAVSSSSNPAIVKHLADYSPNSSKPVPAAPTVRPADISPGAEGSSWITAESIYGNPWQQTAAAAGNRSRTIPVAALESSDLPTTGSNEDIRTRLRNLGREGSAGRDAPGTQSSSALGNTLDSELEMLRAEASPFFGVGGGFRYRTGESGLSRLTEFRAPLEFDFNPYAGRLKMLVEPLFLTSGEIGDDPNRIRRYGSFSLVEEEERFAPSNTSVGGIGIIFGYTTGNFTIDLGTTPLGFEVLNAVGGLDLRHEFDNGTEIGGNLSRRAVKDSVLSYAGAIDPLTNEQWGAVTNNEVTVDLSRSFDGFSVYVDGWYGLNVGTGVDDNEHFGGDFGFTVDLLSRPGRSLRAGFNSTYFSYDKNQRFFTLGHGGYFSPQTFLSSSIPIDYELSTDKLQLKFSGAIGVQYFSEDAAFYFPNRTDLQSDLFEFESEQPVIYDGQTNTDISFRVSSELIYKLTPKMQIRGLIGIDRTADWTESIGLINFQYRPGL